MKRDFSSEFKDVIKNTLSESLKKINFKKSNLNYMREVDNFVQTCNVQKSLYNSFDSINFTINFGFFIPIAYLLIEDTEKLPIFPKEYYCSIRGRTGHLIYNKDEWYELNEKVALVSLTKKLSDDIENHLIPMFQNLQTIDSLLDLLRTKHNERKYHVHANIYATAILELEYGNFERGKEILISEYNEAIIPKRNESKIVYPDGREEIKYSELHVNKGVIALCKRIAEKYNIVFNG